MKAIIIRTVVGVILFASLGYNFMQHRIIWNLYDALHHAGAVLEDNGNSWARTRTGVIPVPPKKLTEVE